MNFNRLNNKILNANYLYNQMHCEFTWLGKGEIVNNNFNLKYQKKYPRKVLNYKEIPLCPSGIFLIIAIIKYFLSMLCNYKNHIVKLLINNYFITFGSV